MKPACWQKDTVWSTISTDSTHAFRGVRSWRYSSNGERHDLPTSSHSNWIFNGGHVTPLLLVVDGAAGEADVVIGREQSNQAEHEAAQGLNEAKAVEA